MTTAQFIVSLVTALGLGPTLGAIFGARIARKTALELDRQRLRLEREYQIYAELWDKLFEMRRKIASLDPLFVGSPEPMQAITDSFNAYQAVVRRNEPFIIASVYEPARSILDRGWRIVGSHRDREAIRTQKDEADSDAEQELAAERIRLGNEIHECLNKIDQMMTAVRAAIREGIW